MATGMHFFFKVQVVERGDELVCDDGAVGRGVLVVLDQPVGLQRVGDGAGEFEIYACRVAVRRHELDVHVHFLGRVAVAGFLVPFVFVFAGLVGARVKLVGAVFYGEGYFGGGVCGADEAEGWGVG